MKTFSGPLGPSGGCPPTTPWATERRRLRRGSPCHAPGTGCASGATTTTTPAARPATGVVMDSSRNKIRASCCIFLLFLLQGQHFMPLCGFFFRSFCQTAHLKCSRWALGLVSAFTVLLTPVPIFKPSPHPQVIKAKQINVYVFSFKTSPLSQVYVIEIRAFPTQDFRTQRMDAQTQKQCFRNIFF